MDIHKEFSFLTCSIISCLTFGDKDSTLVHTLHDCVQDLLQAWNHWSIQILTIIPLLRFLPNPGLQNLKKIQESRDHIVKQQLKWHKVGTAGAPAPLASASDVPASSPTDHHHCWTHGFPCLCRTV